LKTELTAKSFRQIRDVNKVRAKPAFQNKDKIKSHSVNSPASVRAMWTFEGTINFDQFWWQTSRFRFSIFSAPKIWTVWPNYTVINVLGHAANAAAYVNGNNNNNNNNNNNGKQRAALTVEVRLRNLVRPPGRDGLLAQAVKSVGSKLHFALLISRFRSIVAKVFDFRLRFNDRLITTICTALVNKRSLTVKRPICDATLSTVSHLSVLFRYHDHT